MKLNIDPFWRPAYEVYAGIVWWAAGLATFFFLRLDDSNPYLVQATVVPMMLFGLVRIGQAFALWERKAKLVQQSDFTMKGKQLRKLVAKAQRRARRGKLNIE